MSETSGKWHAGGCLALRRAYRKVKYPTSRPALVKPARVSAPSPPALVHHGGAITGRTGAGLARAMPGLERTG